MTAEEAIRYLRFLASYEEMPKHPKETFETAIEALEKFEEYKRLEEQGLLLRLPCKVGDTVYKIWDKSVIEATVDCIRPFVFENDIEFRGNVTIIIRDPFFNDNRLTKHTSFAIFNDDTFFTREEAERKLKEMEENV